MHTNSSITVICMREVFLISFLLSSQHVDNYEYELPKNFEDEEIEEDEAFNSEDERRYGHLFGKRGGASDSEEEGDEEDSESEGDLLDSEEEEESGSGEEEDYDSDLEEAFARAGAAGESDEEEEEEDMIQQLADNDDDDAREAMVRAVTGGKDASGKERRRRREVVVTEAYPESEFNLPAAGQ